MPIECRIEGVQLRGEPDEHDREDQSLSVYWYNPANQLISRSTENVVTYYQGEGIFLEVQNKAVTPGLYRCVSQVGSNGDPKGVAYIGLYLSEGK